jgi:hypothetical protein
MHTKAFVSGLIVTVAGFVVGGCVSSASVRNEPRDTVRFASATGAQTFYEAYLARYYARPTQGYVAFGVPLPYEHHELKTDNVSFNAAVSVADVNHDGVISDEEARAYNDKVKSEREAVATAAAKS